MSVFVLNFVLVGMFVLPNLLQLAIVIHLIMENLHKVIVIRVRTPTENRRKVSAEEENLHSAPFFEGSFKATEVSKKTLNEGKP